MVMMIMVMPVVMVMRVVVIMPVVMVVVMVVIHLFQTTFTGTESGTEIAIFHIAARGGNTCTFHGDGGFPAAGRLHLQSQAPEHDIYTSSSSCCYCR